MQGSIDESLCDRCDRMLRNVNISEEFGERKRRFLNAYRQQPIIARAARLAGVHRATVYRWLKDEGFATALKVTANEFFHEHRKKIRAQEEARRQWRQARERERSLMRCYYLDRARQARR